MITAHLDWSTETDISTIAAYEAFVQTAVSALQQADLGMRSVIVVGSPITSAIFQMEAADILILPEKLTTDDNRRIMHDHVRRTPQRIWQSNPKS